MESVTTSESSSLKRRNKQWVAEERKSAALRRLAVDEKALQRMPDISEILSEAGVSKAQAIKTLRFSDDQLAITFLDTYDSLPLTDRDRVPLEALILKSGVNPVHFLGTLFLAVRENTINRSKMIAMANHPEVMQATVEAALIPGGYRDREQLHIMTGALPSNKGVTVFQKFSGVTPDGPQKPAEPVQEAEIVETDANYIFPDSSRMQERLSPIRQKMLESGK